MMYSVLQEARNDDVLSEVDNGDGCLHDALLLQKTVEMTKEALDN